jgi:taurine dioxygenase
MTITAPDPDLRAGLAELPDLTVRPLSRHIGAEVGGLDLHRALDDREVAAVRALLHQYKVLFFRGHHLTPDLHLAFAEQFGETTKGHPVIPGLPDNPKVFEIDYSQAEQYRDAFQKSNVDYDARVWHTDVTFVERPPSGSILNAVTIPEAGGDTQWSNQAAAFAALSPSLQDYLRTLTAVHDGSDQFGWILEHTADAAWEGERITSIDPVEHPLVRTHDETGEEILYVNPGFTRGIKELEPAEAQALLGFLHQHSVRPQFTVRWHWSQGDLAFWDNRATQHAVVPDFSGQHRVIQRVTLRGERPV